MSQTTKCSGCPTALSGDAILYTEEGAIVCQNCHTKAQIGDHHKRARINAKEAAFFIALAMIAQQIIAHIFP